MSIFITTQVWEQAPFTGARLLVLLALADAASREGFCYPSVGTIAQMARITKRNVNKHLVALEAAGWLERAPEYDALIKGRQTSNAYHVMIPPPVASDSPPPVASDSPPLSPATAPPCRQRQPPPVASDILFKGRTVR